MKKNSLSILVVALLIFAGTAILLTTVQKRQRVGKPGVKVGTIPIYNPDGKLISGQSVDLPETVLDFTSKQLPITDLELNWLPKDTTYGRRLYTDKSGFQLMLNTVLMGRDRTSIHKPEYCLRGQGWEIDFTKAEHTTVTISKPHSYDLPVLKYPLHRYVKNPDGTIQAVSGIYVFWFVADGRLTADHTQRMWWMARDLLQKQVLERWAYVICAAQCPPGQEDAAFAKMKEFIADSVPQFQLTTGAPKTGIQSASLE